MDDDAAHVIENDLQELINKKKDLKLTIPPQFLTDILKELKEGAKKVGFLC